MDHKNRLKVHLKHYYPQLLVGMALLVVAGILAQTVRPSPRTISDPTRYREPFKTYEQVPFPMLIVLCVVIPVAIMSSYAVGLGDLDLFLGIAAFLTIAFGACFFTTETLKLTVRRPRPYVQYVIPPGSPQYALKRGFLERHLKKEGFKSFPSGHTSNGICGTVSLLLFFSGQLRPFHSQRPVWKTLLMLFTLLVPLGIAIYVAVTRVQDNRHHVSDVLCGALIGLVSSVCSYFSNFYFIWEPESNVPRFTSAPRKEPDCEIGE